MATAPIEEAENPRAVAGNNLPPSIKEQALVVASEVLKPLLTRAEELTASADKAHANDAEAAAKCADLVKMIRACDTALKEKRMEVQAPYKAAVDVIMDLPRKHHAALDRAKKDVSALISEWDKKERKRLKDIEEEKRKEEEAEAERLAQTAASMGVELPPEEEKPLPARRKPVSTVDSDMGSSVYARKVTVYTVTDVFALPSEILNHEKVIEAIKSVAREMHRAAPDQKIRGILITEEETVVVR